MWKSAWLGIAPLTASCALISGLDGITVVKPGTDGSVTDSSSVGDAGLDAIADTTGAADAQIMGDARAGTALQMTAMCGTHQISDLTSYSNKDFTVTFWYQPLASLGGVGRHPIVWRGGRAAGESGWMIGVEGNGLIVCAADPNGGGCTTAVNNWTLPTNHLLHVAVVSKVGMNAIPRTLAAYVLDWTNNEKTHVLVASGTGPNNWTLPLGLAIGGAAAFQCDQTVNGVIDDLRLWSRQLAAGEVDTNYKTSIGCADLGLTSNYRFDEGTGSATEDCANKLNLTLKGSYAWVPSPFP